MLELFVFLFLISFLSFLISLLVLYKRKNKNKPTKTTKKVIIGLFALSSFFLLVLLSGKSIKNFFEYLAVIAVVAIGVELLMIFIRAGKGKPNKLFKKAVAVSSGVLTVSIVALIIVPLIPKAPPDLSAARNYDTLQSLFLSIDKSTTADDIENYCNKNSLCFFRRTSKIKKDSYRVAFTEEDAVGLKGYHGDYIEVNFDEDANGRIKYATYYNSSAFSAVFYNYGIYNDFREEYPGVYSGYYTNDMLGSKKRNCNNLQQW